MVCTKLDAGICKAIVAPCPKKYEMKMVTFRKCPNFGKAVTKKLAKTKSSKKILAKKVKKAVSKARK